MAPVAPARPRRAATVRSYVAAVLLNLALVNTVLTPPDRPRAAQTRVAHYGRRFRDTELIHLRGGDTGVLSVPYEHAPGGGTIGAN